MMMKSRCPRSPRWSEQDDSRRPVLRDRAGWCRDERLRVMAMMVKKMMVVVMMVQSDRDCASLTRMVVRCPNPRGEMVSWMCREKELPLDPELPEGSGRLRQTPFHHRQLSMDGIPEPLWSERRTFRRGPLSEVPRSIRCCLRRGFQSTAAP